MLKRNTEKVLPGARKVPGVCVWGRGGGGGSAERTTACKRGNELGVWTK